MLEKTVVAGADAYQGADYDLAMAHSLLGRVLNMGGQFALAFDLYLESQRLFEALGKLGESMVSTSLTEQADCLAGLGRLDEAAEKYEESIKLDKKREALRDVAIGTLQLSTVRLLQKRYSDALAGYTEVKNFFEAQNEPKEVAGSWHQIGRVYLETGNYEQAEFAYQQSLKIRTQINAKVDQAMSLGELGHLYAEKLHRPEEAVTFSRQAVDIYVETGNLRSEGLARSNIANTLRKLKRYDEARAEIMRAIECYKPFGTAVELWNSFEILRRIEEATGNPTAARAAWVQARDAYLAYRRQGGYAQGGGGQLVEQVIRDFQQGEQEKPLRFLAQAPQAADTPDWLKVFAPKILAVLQGSCDRALGDDAALNYADAAEVLFLMERLEGSN